MAKDNATPVEKKSGNLVRNVLIGLLVVAFVGVGAFGHTALYAHLTQQVGGGGGQQLQRT